MTHKLVNIAKNSPKENIDKKGKMMNLRIINKKYKK